jgi:hypothetical protein
MDFSGLEESVLGECWQILPTSALDDNVPYEVVCEPIRFLEVYCKLSELYEQNEFPQFSALPLRRSHIQSHIRIDTMMLADHILRIPRSQVGRLTDERKRQLWSQVKLHFA